MTLQKFVYGLLMVSLIIGCGGSKKSSGPKSTTLIDALTDFSIAINANNFKKAVDYLVESEKNELIEANGNVGEESQRRLKALRLQILIKNPRIQLSGNKITGILSALPSLQHSGPNDQEESSLDVETQLENVENDNESQENGSEIEQNEDEEAADDSEPIEAEEE